MRESGVFKTIKNNGYVLKFYTYGQIIGFDSKGEEYLIASKMRFYEPSSPHYDDYLKAREILK